MVTDRRVKVNPATGEVDKFKTRHCINGSIRCAAKQRAADPFPFYSGVADDMQCKLVCADAADRNRELTAADIGNAYLNGVRRGGRPSYAWLPSCLTRYSEAGERMVLELASPLWGEPCAGREWQTELARALSELGLQRAEGVPCMWYFNGQHSDVRVITIVDDMLFSESEGSTALTDSILDGLRSRFEVTVRSNPDHFAGIRLERNRTARSLTLSMPQKVGEARLRP